MTFVDNPLYRRDGFGVRYGISVVALATLPWISNITSVAAQSVYREVAVADGAQLVGTAVFHADIPDPRRLLVTKDEEVCGFGYLERNEVAVGEEGGLAGVVVVVEGVQAGKAWPDERSGHVLDQKDCVFLPHLQVVPKTADMNIVNSDPVLHNLHAYELMDASARTLFNLGQPPGEGVIVRPLRPRLSNLVRLECDAHDFMQGWIYADDSPYWAVTRKRRDLRHRRRPAGGILDHRVAPVPRSAAASGEPQCGRSGGDHRRFHGAVAVGPVVHFHRCAPVVDSAFVVRED